MLADQPHAPGQRVGARPGDTGVDQGVEDQPLRLAQPGHHRRGDVGPELGVLPDGSLPRRPWRRSGARPRGRSPSAGRGSPRGTPSRGRPGPRTGDVGGVVAELHVGDGEPDRDLLAVDGDVRRGGLPLRGEPTGEPAGHALSRLVCNHDYIITPLQETATREDGIVGVDEPGLPTLYDWAGGGEALRRFIDAFYDRVERDDLLTAFFPGGVTQDAPRARRRLVERGARRAGDVHRRARRLRGDARPPPQPGHHPRAAAPVRVDDEPGRRRRRAAGGSRSSGRR